MLKILPFLLLLFSANKSATAQWIQTSGPEGPRYVQIHTLAFRGDSILAGAYRGGFYLSSDDGMSWQEANAGLPIGAHYPDVYCFWVADDTVFAGTSAGLYRSANFGNTWKAKNTGLPDPPPVISLVKANGNLFAGTYYGVYRSENNGEFWTDARTGLPKDYYGNYHSIESLVMHNGVLFAGTYDGVYRSTNDGETWTAVNNGIPFEACCHARVVCFLSKDNILIAGTFGRGGGVYSSIDNGETWRPINVGLPRYSSGSIRPVWSLVERNDVLFAGTDTGVYRHHRSDSSWSAVNKGLPENLFVPTLAKRDDKLFAASHRGIYRLEDDRETWAAFFTTHFTNISVRALGNIGENLFAAGNVPGTGIELVYRTNDNGENWLLADSVLANTYITNFISFRNNIYAGGKGVYLSRDNGMSWKSISMGLPRFRVNSLLFTDGFQLFAGMGNYEHLGDTAGGVYISTDKGTTWKPAGLQGQFVHSLAAIGNDVFAGVYHNFETNGVYRTSDSGTNWTLANTGLPDSVAVLTLATKRSLILAGTNDGVYLSTNNGTRWTRANQGLPSRISIHSLIAPGNQFFAGTNQGVYLSSNSTQWSAISNGLDGKALMIRSLTYFGNVIFAGTDAGVWRRPISEVVVSVSENDDETISGSFQLAQNFPNPFNSNTIIQFAIPKSTNVTLKVYDSLGREVATLVHRRLDAGLHSINWQAGGIASGIYFYRLQAGSFAQMKKFVHLQ